MNLIHCKSVSTSKITQTSVNGNTWRRQAMHLPGALVMGAMPQAVASAVYDLANPWKVLIHHFHVLCVASNDARPVEFYGSLL